MPLEDSLKESNRMFAWKEIPSNDPNIDLQTSTNHNKLSILCVKDNIRSEMQFHNVISHAGVTINNVLEMFSDVISQQNDQIKDLVISKRSHKITRRDSNSSRHKSKKTLLKKCTF